MQRLLLDLALCWPAGILLGRVTRLGGRVGLCEVLRVAGNTEVLRLGGGEVLCLLAIDRLSNSILGVARCRWPRHC